ncbi:MULTISPECIES: PepSY domain-containing protein [unclassified Ruegeria]|uniref:PepSY-associated TM helix domain-containing protein n=1 Tax=unclassified Ruegeria TaxID=2625375 RepID=UPI0014926AFD|nr:MULTISPECIES: PepSY-associated TM helix domain-containing protein [unclassified Ruegeria]NOD49798.1 hypothetical protein [Ruegeria sp. HKCCD5849]NOD54100.1 hypothetical protein [Ruegeria sp. HKCCD5851]
MNRKIRNSLFKIHTWMGLHLSLFFVFMFLTGTLLVAGFELESVGRPNIWTTAAKEDRTASFGMMYDGIKEAHPESGVFVMIKRPAPWFADRTFGRTGWGENVSFWTDPATGAVVGETRPNGFRDILRDLHDTFLTENRIIFILVSATSIPLLFQIISGLITYRRFWKGFFRWPSSAGGLRPWAGSAHRLTAIWSAPVVILIAVTSFYFLLGGLGFDGTYPEPKPPVTRDTALPANFGPALIDQAAARARDALPGFEPTVMLVPDKKTGSLGFSGPLNGVPEFFGTGNVSIDPVTLEVLGAFTPGEIGGLAYLKSLMDALHFGTWGGVASMALWIVFGLVLTGVAFTGALIFAARLAPEAAQYGPIRRIWRGIGWTRWAYLLLLAGILLTAFTRFGPGSHDKTRAFPVDAPVSVARLIMQAPLRRDTPLDVELRIGDPDVSAARVEINDGEVQQIDVTSNGKRASAHFQMTPSDAENTIIARLQNPDGTENTVTFRLGRPLW